MNASMLRHLWKYFHYFRKFIQPVIKWLMRITKTLGLFCPHCISNFSCGNSHKIWEIFTVWGAVTCSTWIEKVGQGESCSIDINCGGHDVIPINGTLRNVMKESTGIRAAAWQFFSNSCMYLLCFLLLSFLIILFSFGHLPPIWGFSPSSTPVGDSLYTDRICWHGIKNQKQCISTSIYPKTSSQLVSTG